MSTVAFVVTKDVRHLSSWTQDDAEHQASEWSKTGAHRPLCGERVRDWTETLWPNFAYEDETIVRRGMAKPVCKRCLTILDRLNEITGDRSRTLCLARADALEGALHMVDDLEAADTLAQLADQWREEARS